MKRMAIVAALLFSGWCAFGAEWIRITKPLPSVGNAVKVGEEYEVRSVLGKGPDKLYTIKARGKVVAVKASDVQLLDAEHVRLKIQNRALKKEIEALKARVEELTLKAREAELALKARVEELTREARKEKKPKPGDHPEPKPKREPDDIPATRVIWREPPKPGTERRRVPSGAKVLSVLGPRELLVKVERSPVVVRTIRGRFIRTLSPGIRFAFHVKGLDTSRMITGMDFGEMQLVYVGTFTYAIAGGGQNTVQSYVPYVRPKK